LTLVKIGVRLYGTDPDALVEKAIWAERLGFESLWRGDHLLIPHEVASTYPYTSSGIAPLDAAGPVLDVLGVLAFVAQATSRIRLVTGVLILPLRHPVQIARAVGTLDVLSKGRAVLGIGVGWLREEFELLNSDYGTRGARTDEAIRLITALWTQTAPAFDGEHYRVHGATFEPKPVQRPRPPIIAGGESPAARRRAALLCDGWYGHVTSPEEAAKVAADLRRRRAQHGSTAPFEITVRANPTLTREDLARFQDVGVDRLVLQIGGFNDARALHDVEAMQAVADRLGLEPERAAA
jgi:probable F420-dependent oxidoreductase